MTLQSKFGGVDEIIPSAEDLDCFAAQVLKRDPTSRLDYTEFQMRSKEDFSLLRTVPDPGSDRYRQGDNLLLLVLFNECFAFLLMEYENSYSCVEVVSLVARHWRTVYRFHMQQDMAEIMMLSPLWPRISSTGSFLVLHSKYNGRLRAMIWKFPDDFIETCHRHFKEGTVGNASQCDQLIEYVERIEEPGVFVCHDDECRIDRFGISRYRSKTDMNTTAAVIDVAMLDSIISDDKT